MKNEMNYYHNLDNFLTSFEARDEKYIFHAMEKRGNHSKVMIKEVK